MEHVGVRGGRSWQDSLNGGWEFSKPAGRGIDQTLHGLRDAALLPGWAKRLAGERFLRFLVPVLVAALLVIVGTLQTLSLQNNARQIERDAARELRTAMALISSRMQLNADLAERITSDEAAQKLLADAFPAATLGTHVRAHLLDTQSAPRASHLLETFDSDLLKAPAGEVTWQTLGSGERVLISRAPLTTLQGKAVGELILTRTEQSIFAGWRSNARHQILLLASLASVMLLFVYAYFAHTKKAVATDLKFAETNARFDTALSRGHCGLWDWDLARGRIVWSSSMYQMLGMETRDHVLGYGDLADLLHPDDGDLSSLANEAVASSDDHVDHRFRMLHTNGSWVWLRMRAELVHYVDAAPHLVGIAVDITEQELLKQQTHDADLRLRDAIENISEAFVLWDARRRLVMCNSKYQQLYKLPNSAVTPGRSHESIMATGRKPRIRHQVAGGVRPDGGTQTFEAQLEDGSWLQISERRTQDGGFVSVGTDITQIKRNEEKLVDSERRMKATIADQRKTQQKTERQAQKLVELAEKYNEERNKAEAANRAKSDFLANISHELRTPLNAIIGFSEIMQAKMFGPLGSEKYEDYAQDIHGSGSFLLGVINDVLDMSKIEAGRFQLHPEEVELDELLEETIRIIRVQADESKISVVPALGRDLALKADRRAVKQIMLNLLSNAVKFTEEGGKIEISAKQNRSSITLFIEDNGVGIPKAALKRLGQPFEQVQDQFTKTHKGSGLGLAIARSLVGLHGGSLKIRSQVGKGTIVAVRLPRICKMQTDVQDQSARAA